MHSPGDMITRAKTITLSLFVVVSLAGCGAESSVPQTPAPVAKAPLPALPYRPAAIAHAGAGTSPENADGCKKAVDAALAVLEKGGDPMDAAVAGVVVLEDDPRFNAGTGSRVRIDGETVQMDASVMRSDGRFAAVAAIEGVKNPVQVARAVMDTPHLLLVGDGATRFARTLGFASYDPATPEMKVKASALQDALRRQDASLPDAWKIFDWRARWNFTRSLHDAGLDAQADGKPVHPGSDTVGVSVRAADGRFATALSTGGTSITLRGRVGDVPIYGAGLFASPHGASAATGTGERIIEAALAREVNAWLEAGVSPEQAAARAVALVKQKKGDIGIVVIGPTSMAGAAGEKMAWAGRVSGETTYLGPN